MAAVTPAELVRDLRRRGVELLTDGDRLGVRPAGQLRPEERAALVAAKADVLALLRAEQQPTTRTHGDGWADGVPDTLCGLCGSPLAWVEDWPSAGEARWLCPTCATWPASALAEVFAGLTADERHRFDAEVANGDHLAVTVLRELRGNRRAAS